MPATFVFSWLLGRSNATAELNVPLTLRFAISTTCSTVNAPDNSLERTASACARRSRKLAIVASNRSFAASCPMVKATSSIKAKVNRYCTSETENENRGGTKKKSNNITDNAAAHAPGPRPNLIEIPTTVNNKALD